MERFFGIDLRGLAVMRVLLGTALLYDLGARISSLEVFLTDDGVLPVSLARSGVPLDWVPSIHLLSGAWGYQAALLLLQACASVALLLGWHTRIATLLCWYFTLSLNFRNEMVLNGGDYLLRSTLFWSVFLPLGARYSWDEIQDRRKGRSTSSGMVANIATAGLLFQICLLYWGSAMNKDPNVWLFKPQALYYALNLDAFTSPLGLHLRGTGRFLGLLTVVTYGLEWLAPVLILVGKPVLRTVGIFLLVFFHLSVGLLMQVGLFWLIPLGALLAFLPSEFWDRVLPNEKGKAPSQEALSWPVCILLGGLLLFLPYLNLSQMKPKVLPTPRPLFLVYRTLGLHYGWTMFARVNRNIDGWYIFEATLSDGSSVDLLTGDKVNYDKPDVSDIYPNQRWRRYLADLHLPGGSRHLRSLGLYLAKKWQSPNKPVQRIRVHFLVEETPEDPQLVKIEDRLLLDFEVER